MRCRFSEYLVFGSLILKDFSNYFENPVSAILIINDKILYFRN